MPTPTDRLRARLLSRPVGVVAVLAVATAVLVLRPVDDETVTGAGTEATTAPSAATSSPSPTSPPVPPPATDEEFCAGFRLLAESQGQFVSSGGDEASDRLRASADSLVAAGVPDAMSLPARSGYYTLMSGVYDTIGLELAPAAVGAPDEPVDGGDAAFSSYLGQYCPP